MRKSLNRAGLLAFFSLAGLAPFYLFFTERLSFYTYHALSGLIALKYQIARSLMQGEFPLWNPFLFGGIPFHTGIGILDPFLLPSLFGEGPRATVVAMIFSGMLAFSTAGVSMHLYLRQSWGLSRLPAVLGGILYLANPFFGATCHEMPFMAPLVFLPLIFLFYDSSLKLRSPYAALLCGFFLSLTFFAGNLESFYFVLLFFILVAVLDRLTEFLFAGKPFFPRELLFPALSIVAAFCFAAIEILPSLKMIADASRPKDGRLFQNLIFFLSLGGALAILSLMIKLSSGKKSPKFLRPLAASVLFFLLTFKLNWTKGYVEMLSNIFFPNIGMLMNQGRDALSFLAIQTNLPPWLIRSFVEPRFIFYIQPPAYFFTLSTLVLFIGTFLYTGSARLKVWCGIALLLILFPYTSVPNLNSLILHLDHLNYPRLMFAFFFIQSIVIAHGFESLQHLRPIFSFLLRLLLLGCGAVLIFFAGLGKIFPASDFEGLMRRFAEGSTGLGWLDLSSLHLKLTLTSLGLFFKADFLVRILTLSKYASFAFLLLLLFSRKSIWKYLFVFSLTLEVLLPWSLYVFQKPDIRNLLTPHAEDDFLKSVGRDERIGSLHDPSITLFNFYDRPYPRADLSANLPLFWGKMTVEQSAINLLPSRARDFWLLEKAHESFAPATLRTPSSVLYDLMGMKYLFSESDVQEPRYRYLGKGDRYFIYENSKALPRFYFARELQTSTLEEIAARIQGESWDPSKTTYIEAPVPVDYRPEAEGKRSIQVRKNKYNKLELETETSAPAFLATTEPYHENWRVFVNGVQKPLIRTNFYFRGVFLDPGRHQVRFVYNPPAFAAGILITLVMIFLTVYCFIRQRHSVQAGVLYQLEEN